MMHSTPMQEITLYTNDGRAVVTVAVPRFLKMPEGLVWGDRVFFLRPDGRYYEGLLWPIIDMYQPKPASSEIDPTSQPSG